MAGGTGNLILKRGNVIPNDGQQSGTTTLLKAMPALQLNGLSHVVNTSGGESGTLVYAYENWPNRLWIGMDAYGTGTPESGAGQGNGSGPGAFGGGSGFSPAAGSESRSLWMGAEIRADAAVYNETSGTPDTVPVILQADWNNPSDLVLVTQKAIHTWASSTFGSSGSVTATSSNTSSTVYPLFVTAVGSSTTLLADNSTTALSYVPSTNILSVNGVSSNAGTGLVLRGVASGTSPVDAYITVSGADLDVAGTPTVAINATNTSISGTLTLIGSVELPSSATISDTATTSSTLNIQTGVTASGNTKTINIGTASGTGSTTNITVGAGSAKSGTVTLDAPNTVITGDLAVNGGDITTTASTASLFDSNANTINVATTGTAARALNIATAATAGASTLTFGGAVTGNTVEINSTTGGTVNLSSDVTTGTVNLYTGVTTGTVNVATGGASTTNIGGAGGSINIGTTGGDSTLTIRGNSTTGTATLATNSGVTTANVFNTNATTVNVGGGATTGVNIGNNSGTVTIASDLKISGSGATAKSLIFHEGSSGAEYVAFKAPNSLTSSTTYVLPDAYPVGTNKVLQSDTSGVLTWVSTGTASAVGVTATDTGTYNLVLTNASSTTDASLYVDDSDNITFDTSSNLLTVGGDLAVNGGDITTTASTATVFNTTATTVNIGGGATSGMSIGNASGTVAIAGSASVGGDLAVNGTSSADITTTTATASLFDSNATTVSVGAAASTLNIGYASSGGQTGAQTINLGTQTSTSAAKTINILTNNATAGASTANILTGVLTGTVNILTGVSGTNANINLGSATATNSTVTVNKDMVVSGNLTVNGVTTTVNSTTLTVDDKNIELGSVSGASGLSGTVGNISGSGPWTADFTVASQVTGIAVGSTIAMGTSTGGSLYGGTPSSVLVTAVSYSGNSTIISYTVTGGTTPTTGNLFNASVTGATDTVADNGGITLKGTTDKTLLWNNTTISGSSGVWRSSEHFSIASGKSFAVVDDIVLNKTTLKLYGNTSGNVTINPTATTTNHTLILPANTQTGVLTNSTSSSTGTLSWSTSLAPTLGGTGLTSYTTGDLIYASATNTLSALAAGTSGYVLRSNGVAAPSWVDPATLSSGAASSVTVRKETNSTTKYPIPFLGSDTTNSPSLTAGGNDFSSWSDGGSKTGYLFTDYSGQTTGTSPTEMSAGLMYQVSDNGTATTGTLYCDYIGAMLDCGTYS